MHISHKQRVAVLTLLALLLFAGAGWTRPDAPFAASAPPAARRG